MRPCRLAAVQAPHRPPPAAVLLRRPRPGCALGLLRARRVRVAAVCLQGSKDLRTSKGGEARLASAPTVGNFRATYRERRRLRRLQRPRGCWAFLVSLQLRLSASRMCCEAPAATCRRQNRCQWVFCREGDRGRASCGIRAAIQPCRHAVTASGQEMRVCGVGCVEGGTLTSRDSDGVQPAAA